MATTAALSPSLSGSSSPLSSIATPSPPTIAYLPSPASQDHSDNSIPVIDLNTPSICNGVDPDGPPPPKRRRTIQPKPRFTRRLDLSDATRSPLSPGTSAKEEKDALDLLLKVLHKRRKIVVVAGAGISVSAGIPDFRSRTGLFSTSPKSTTVKATGKHLFDASVYKTDAATSQFHDMVRSLADLAGSSKPTAFHQLLARVAEEGRLLRLYTQNVDGLDVALQPLATNVPLNAKAPWPRTIQLHGGLGKMVCQKCHHLSDFDPSLFEGPDPPPCKECKEMDSVRTNIAGKRSHGVGRLRPRIVLYNEHNPDEDAIGAVTRNDLKSRPDALIVVGTSLKVRGVRRIVKEMCGVVRGRRDGVTVWINSGEPPMGKEFEDCWDLVIKSESDAIARVADGSRSSISPTPAGEEIDDHAWVEMKNRGGPSVVVDGSQVATKAEDERQNVLAPLGGILTAKPDVVGSSVEPSKAQAKSATSKATKRTAAALSTAAKPKKAATAGKPAAATVKAKAKAKKGSEAKPASVQRISTVFKSGKSTTAAAATAQKAKSGLKTQDGATKTSGKSPATNTDTAPTQSKPTETGPAREEERPSETVTQTTQTAKKEEAV